MNPVDATVRPVWEHADRGGNDLGANRRKLISRNNKLQFKQKEDRQRLIEPRVYSVPHYAAHEREQCGDGDTWRVQLGDERSHVGQRLQLKRQGARERSLDRRGVGRFL